MKKQISKEIIEENKKELWSLLFSPSSRIYKHIDSLGLGKKQVLYLKYVILGMNGGETANLAGVKVNTVRSTMSQIRGSLGIAPKTGQNFLLVGVIPWKVLGLAQDLPRGK